MTKVGNVTELFKNGCNCTQSMLAVYGKALGIDYETALKIGNAFGGGMARTGETCGAVTGALMIIGLKYGAADVKDKHSKSRTYELAAEFIKKFEGRNRTTICRELLGFEIGSNNNPNKYKMISQACPKFVKDAAEIIEEMLRSEDAGIKKQNN